MTVADLVVDDGSDSADPCARLWRAVVTQAFRDALTPDPPADWRKDYERYKTSASAAVSTVNIPIVRSKAMSWLMDGSAGFHDVCMLAGLDPETVRAAARRVFASEQSIEEARRAIAAPVATALRPVRGAG